MMSRKMATIRYFEIRHYDVIISVYDLTNKISSRDSSYLVNAVMWQLWHFYERSYHNLNFIRI